MFKNTIILATLFLAPSAQAVELQNATSQQILDEISRRLHLDEGTRYRGFSATSTCDRGYFKVGIHNRDYQNIASLVQNAGSECEELLDILPFGTSGRIRVGQQFAFCDVSLLNVYEVLSDGSLSVVSSSYQGSQVAHCWVAARRYNEQI